MVFEDLQSELGLLMKRMQNEPKDRHELYLVIRQKLNEMKAYGMPLPDDLVRFEQQLEAEFASDAANSGASTQMRWINRASHSLRPHPANTSGKRRCNQA